MFFLFFIRDLDDLTHLIADARTSDFGVSQTSPVLLSWTKCALLGHHRPVYGL